MIILIVLILFFSPIVGIAMLQSGEMPKEAEKGDEKPMIKTKRHKGQIQAQQQGLHLK